jgi:hypothetical protein
MLEDLNHCFQRCIRVPIVYVITCIISHRMFILFVLQQYNIIVLIVFDMN